MQVYITFRTTIDAVITRMGQHYGENMLNSGLMCKHMYGIRMKSLHNSWMVVYNFGQGFTCLTRRISARRKRQFDNTNYQPGRLGLRIATENICDRWSRKLVLSVPRKFCPKSHSQLTLVLWHTYFCSRQIIPHVVAVSTEQTLLHVRSLKPAWPL